MTGYKTRQYFDIYFIEEEKPLEMNLLVFQGVKNVPYISCQIKHNKKKKHTLQ